MNIATVKKVRNNYVSDLEIFLAKLKNPNPVNRVMALEINSLITLSSVAVEILKDWEDEKMRWCDPSEALELRKMLLEQKAVATQLIQETEHLKSKYPNAFKGYDEVVGKFEILESPVPELPDGFAESFIQERSEEFESDQGNQLVRSFKFALGLPKRRLEEKELKKALKSLAACEPTVNVLITLYDTKKSLQRLKNMFGVAGEQFNDSTSFVYDHRRVLSQWLIHSEMRLIVWREVLEDFDLNELEERALENLIFRIEKEGQA